MTTYRIPLALLVSAVAGLLLALVSDGWLDDVACLLLATAPIMIARAWLADRAG